jgi:hypothetical protein
MERTPDQIARQRAASKKHYENNKQQYFDRNKRAKERMQVIVREAKNKPCTDCKQSYPHYVMHFDHIGTDKEFNIADRVNHNNVSAMLAEIAKCEVVCANCHQIRTWMRLHPEDMSF